MVLARFMCVVVAVDDYLRAFFLRHCYLCGPKFTLRTDGCEVMEEEEEEGGAVQACFAALPLLNVFSILEE